MSRWKYATATVKAGENAASVRQLSAGERARFAHLAAEPRKDAGAAVGMMIDLVVMGSIESLSREEVEQMPGQLLELAAQKILELSGLKEDEAKKE